MTRLNLGLLPVKAGSANRTANIICCEGHEIWTKRSESSLRAFLEKSFPQLNISDLVSDEVSARLNVFEYTRHVKVTFAVLIGWLGASSLCKRNGWIFSKAAILYSVAQSDAR